MTHLYFAIGCHTIDEATFGMRPGLSHLVALQNFRGWEKQRHLTRPGRWCLDSGAYEAYTQGKPITYEQWHEIASTCDADEVFGLDVIGSPRKTRANVERAWADGIRAIPTFHFGAPWEYLEWAATSAPKFALGGMARRRDSERIGFIRECFKRQWPCRVHGFGVTSRKSVMAVPFHSVDSTTWLGGRRFKIVNFNRHFGAWRRDRIPSKNSFDNQVHEVDTFVTFFEYVAHCWRKEMALLDSLPDEWKL